jgi:hypothetical protein
MGYYGNLELKYKAQKMRELGKSYREIMQVLHLSKSTTSDWCKNITLTQDQINKLYSAKKQGALKGSIIAAQRKIDQRIIRTKQLFDIGTLEIGTLNKRERFISGISFYAAEGTKIDKGCCFSNSDPLIIKFMVNWFMEFGNVDTGKFRGAIWLHEGLNENNAKKYWSKLTNIPLEHFYKTYIAINKINSKKIRKNKHEFGIFSLYINDTNLLRKIMGWIGGVLMNYP